MIRFHNTPIFILRKYITDWVIQHKWKQKDFRLCATHLWKNIVEYNHKRGISETGWGVFHPVRLVDKMKSPKDICKFILQK